MPPVGFEPTISAGERPQTYALDRAATGTGVVKLLYVLFVPSVSGSFIMRFGWSLILFLKCQMFHVVHCSDYFIWLESCNSCSLASFDV